MNVPLPRLESKCPQHIYCYQQYSAGHRASIINSSTSCCCVGHPGCNQKQPLCVTLHYHQPRSFLAWIVFDIHKFSVNLCAYHWNIGNTSCHLANQVFAVITTRLKHSPTPACVPAGFKRLESVRYCLNPKLAENHLIKCRQGPRLTSPASGLGNLNNYMAFAMTFTES